MLQTVCRMDAAAEPPRKGLRRVCNMATSNLRPQAEKWTKNRFFYQLGSVHHREVCVKHAVNTSM